MSRPDPATRRHAAAPEEGERVLLGKLIRAFYWLDDGLQAHMRRHAGFSLPRAQSMIMVSLSRGATRQSDLARHLRVSKQAIQQTLRPMVEKGLVSIDPDPENRRQRLVRMTPQGEAMSAVARSGLEALERELAARIGGKRLEALHDALDADWGSPPDDD